MSDQKKRSDCQPVNVAFREETIHAPTSSDGVQVSITEERLDFSSPLVLAGPPHGGWPFGPNPIRVEGIVQDIPTEVDQVEMPATYQVIKWLFLISDVENDLIVTSEIKAMRRGGDIWFTEYAIMGDSTLLHYDLDVVDDGTAVRLVITNRTSGVLTTRTVRLGIFS